MKVGFVSQPIDTIIPPNQNSVGSHTYGIARALAKRCDVVVYGIENNHKAAGSAAFADNLRFRFFESAPSDQMLIRARNKLSKFVQLPTPVSISELLFPTYGKQVAMDLRKQGCDVIHVQHCSQYVPVIRAYNPGAKIVLLTHAEWFSQMKRSILSPRLGEVDLMLTVSDYITEKTKRDYPEVSNRCETMYYGIEAKDFDREKDFSSLNQRAAKRILFAGAISPQKGPHVLVEAFKNVVRRFPDVRLDFAGPIGNYPLDESFDLNDRPLIKSVAPFYAQNHFSRLKARFLGSNQKPLTYRSYLTDDLPQDVSSKIAFHGNVGVRQDLVNRYYNADLFAFAPIWNEGFGIPPVEAMAAGTPVVGSRSGAMVETVKHGETGFLVEKNDPRALAEAILRLLENDSLREEMGRAARRWVMEHFTWETVAEKMFDRYQRLCGVSSEVKTDAPLKVLLPQSKQ